VAAGAGTVVGPVVRFDIPSVINLSQTGGEMNGFFVPDDQMPGIPGTFAGMNAISAEIVAFVELPAGLITMGVACDDGFRTQIGFINDPSTGQLLSESDLATTNNFKFLVQYAGVYPLRTVWYDNVDLAHVEWFTVKPDGTKVLLNDTANG